MSDFSADDSWYTLLSECLRLTDAGRQELPVILLLGPPGTGKTAALGRIKNSVVKPASPVAHVEFHHEAGMSVKDTMQRISHDLMLTHKVKLPRTVFALVVLNLNPDLSDDMLEERLRTLLRGKGGSSDALGPLKDMVSSVPEIGSLLRSLISAFELIIRRPVVTDLLHRKARAWLSGRLKSGNIFDLARDHNSRGRVRAEFAEALLCQALLEDLARSWSKHRFPRNCLLLLDNADTPAGDAFLKALIAARTERTEADPLVVVAASSTWPRAVTHWTQPGVVAPHAVRPPLLGAARHADWLDRRGPGAQGWWYPVLMPPAVTHRVRGHHASAVHDLTAGHPRATRLLLDLTGNAGDDDKFRAVLHDADTLRRLLPDHLAHRDRLIAWSAATNLDDAEDAPFAGAGESAHLRHHLAERLWLTFPAAEGTTGQTTVVHPWLRRLLLHQLARKVAGWDAAHQTMERFYLERDTPDRAAAMHHRLARVTPDDTRGLDEVAAFLNEQFELLDVRAGGGSRLTEWIRLYDRVSAASNRLPLDEPLESLYEGLAVDPADTERRNRASVIRTLVVARWFWLDPLLDPSETRIEEIAHDFRELSMRSSTGRAVLSREADRYERRPER
jgi:hypothetical protein